MSSILDALKKAEQESTTDRGAGTPWPSPLPGQSSYRRRTRRWWVLLGLVVVLGVSGAVFWQTRQPETTMPAASVKVAPSSHKIHDNAPPLVAKNRKPNVPVVQEKQDPLAKAMIEDSPRQAAGNVSTSAVKPIAPMAVTPPVKPVKKPLRAATPAAAPMVQPPPLPLEKTQPQTAVSKPEPVIAPPVAPIRRPAETAEATGQPMTELPDSGKIFRSDPRIELQALVWAPEAATRFVVINNRLIKEGGSVDNIVVVRINQDDVLLAEGSDQWHEEFKIR